MRFFSLLLSWGIVLCSITAAEKNSRVWQPMPLDELFRIERERRAAGIKTPPSQLTGGGTAQGWQPFYFWQIPPPWLPNLAEKPWFFRDRHLNFYPWRDSPQSVSRGLPLGVDPAAVGFPYGPQPRTPQKMELKKYQYRPTGLDSGSLRDADPRTQQLKQYQYRSERPPAALPARVTPGSTRPR